MSYGVLITADVVLIAADVGELALIGVDMTNMTEHGDEMKGVHWLTLQATPLFPGFDRLRVRLGGKNQPKIGSNCPF